MSEEILGLKARVDLLEGVVMRFLLGTLTKDSVGSLVETLDLPSSADQRVRLPSARGVHKETEHSPTRNRQADRMNRKKEYQW